MAASNRSFEERYFASDDGLKLYYRDYAAEEPDRMPVLCLHGLTRNSRDFAPLATVIVPRHRVIAFDFRGRGRSDYDPDWHNYHPARYVDDVWKLVDELGLTRVALLGTSLGGLMAMLMHSQRPDCVAAVVLNDIGPRIDPDGIARVAANVGTLPVVADLDAAIAATKANYGMAFPKWNDEKWKWLTEVTYRQTDEGSYELNFDRNIGVAVREGVSGLRVDPWELYASLEQTPVLLVHGAISDILTDDIIVDMRDKKPDLEVVVVPDTGHAPMLDEPEAVNAILEFLDRLT